MKLSDILVPEAIKVPLDADTKEHAIRELIELLASADRVKDTDSTLQAVMDRESTRTTGIGHGLAIPHGKCNSVPSLVMAVGKPATPIDFNSIDGKPVNIIVLLASPLDQTGPHIQALARISRLMTMEHFRHALAKADSADRVYKVILDHDESGA